MVGMRAQTLHTYVWYYLLWSIHTYRMYLQYGVMLHTILHDEEYMVTVDGMRACIPTDHLYLYCTHLWSSVYSYPYVHTYVYLWVCSSSIKEYI